VTGHAGQRRHEPVGRNKVEDRRTVLFWVRSTMREEGHRPGEKVPAGGFMPTLFGIGHKAKSREIAAFVTQYSGDNLALLLGM